MVDQSNRYTHVGPILVLCFAAGIIHLGLGAGTPEAMTSEAAAEGRMGPAVPQQLWAVRGGSTTFFFDLSAMAERGLSVESTPGADDPAGGALAQFTVDGASSMTFAVLGRSLDDPVTGEILHAGQLTLVSARGEFVLSNLILRPTRVDAADAKWEAVPLAGRHELILNRVKVGFDPVNRMLTVYSPELRISSSLAEVMGDPKLADANIGSVTVHAHTAWIGGAAPFSGGTEAPDPPQSEEALEASFPACGPESGPCNEPNSTPGCDHVECCTAVCERDPFCCEVEWDENCVGPNELVPGASCRESCNGPGQPCDENGADMTFCQLMGLYQAGRAGDIVGLTIGTTSWNIGVKDLMWWPIPNEEHPFIVMNMFRLKDDRLEQIGQSHIKHGFYALGSHQCGGDPCSYEPGHSSGWWLGTGCTDTYSAGLNAVQSGMAPRYDVNPWTGYWYHPGSHIAGSHTHDGQIEHRIQVHDADLNPAQNPGATYFGEGFYVVLDDINVMNSASWKPTTVSGTPGGTWSFGMSSSGVYPNTGFAIDAWTGAQQTVLAQEVPVIEFESPDGRCVLAAKATEVGEGVHHYEYALYNVDMDRQVGTFSIPVPPDASITNIGFHAVQHFDEPYNTADADAVPIENAPWVATVAGGAITWSTTTNPLRWGTMYNFRFDADVAPTDSTVTLGMFRPGTPQTVTGSTVGPLACVPNPDLDGDGEVRVPDLIILLSSWGPCECCPADLDGDGQVRVPDLILLLAAWGPV